MKIAFISDIHEDLISLKRAMKLIEKKGCDEIICLGDISGFSVPYYKHYKTRNASECLSIVRNSCSSIVLGNHDLFATKKLPDISPNFQFPDEWYTLDYWEKRKLAEDKLWINEVDELNPLYLKADIEYLSSCKEFELKEKQDSKFLISHYVYPNLTGCEKKFYLNYKEFSDHFKFMKDKDCNLSFAGHFHPEGICYASDSKFVHKGFKTIEIPKSPAVVICPAIAKGKNKNGFLIFDTKENTISAKKL